MLMYVLPRLGCTDTPTAPGHGTLSGCSLQLSGKLVPGTMWKNATATADDLQVQFRDPARQREDEKARRDLSSTRTFE